MCNRKHKFTALAVLSLFLLALMLLGESKTLPFLVPFVFAHCDTLDGPVIQAAKKALETGNIDLVLIWIKQKDEPEIREVFKKALAERKSGPQTREVADTRFFETLVRVHRAGEGEPYAGIKPAGSEVEPGIMAADKAIESGSAEALKGDIAAAAARGIDRRFQEAMEKKAHMRESIEAGRRYVAAYVEFIH